VGTFNSQGCLPNEQRFPEWYMEPDGQFSGGLVLDLPSSGGTIVYTDETGTEWRWKF
jgi:hypothetical protein